MQTFNITPEKIKIMQNIIHRISLQHFEHTQQQSQKIFHLNMNSRSLVITLEKGWLGRVSVAFKLTFYVHNNSHVVQRALQLHISILINYKQNNSKATHILVMMVWRRERESEGVNKKRKIKRNKILFEHERINLWNRICFTLLFFFCCCHSYAQRNETLKQKKNFF